MTWFEDMTGIQEQSPEQVRRELSIDTACIVCPNGERIAFGSLQTPTLTELRSAVATSNFRTGRTRIREVVGDVQQLHRDPANANAIFQVASQFNLLEMASPSVTPERGVGIYQHDHTQGPACAIACGAGAIYRNYFARVGNAVGQSENRQIDCSARLGRALGNTDSKLWQMQNGYLLPTDQGLPQITTRLRSADETQLDEWRGELQIGLQGNAAVTLPNVSHRVSQAYCSALPVAYGRHPTDAWTDFAKLILDAAYEATILAGILNASRTGVKKVFLTLLGGGVFGNRDEWIIAAIERAVEKYSNHDLDISIVSYGSSKREVAACVSKFC